ncbi:MAG: hypothetical protein Q8P29_01480 [Candidatus Levybacteria bacterium]|nr:hypothetical protein [Candidatus Levybacteria bacterium]MDZ4228512.1 hypothetical protein [Candidatus Levybacteria bacterium]
MIKSFKDLEVHVNMARDLGFWEKKFCNEVIQKYLFLGGKLTNLRNNWKTY